MSCSPQSWDLSGKPSSHRRGSSGCSQGTVQTKPGVFASGAIYIEMQHDLVVGADVPKSPSSVGVRACAVMGREDAVGR